MAFGSTPWKVQNATHDDGGLPIPTDQDVPGQGEALVDSSASNHVTGLENGSGSGWWTHTVGDGIGTSSGTSWGSPWSQSYDKTVSYPGFYEGTYYGNAYRGNNADEYIEYLGDAFSEYSGSDTGFFPSAYSREEPLFAQAQGGNQGPMPANAEVNWTGQMQRSGTDALRESAGRAELYVASTSRTPALGHPGEKRPSAPSRETHGSGEAIVMVAGDGRGGGAPAGGWSNPRWEGTKGFFSGLLQGAANIVNGVQDTLVGVFNVLPSAVNAIAWAEELVGILNAEKPIRVPSIPSPDWSRGLITREGGTPGSWSDTHGWSKFAGATGVEAAVGAWAVKAARAASAATAGRAGRTFGELIKDVAANPSKWQIVKKEIVPSSNIRNKGGWSVQELLRNSDTGEQVVRHTLLKADGTLFELPHFRPFWKQE